MNFSSWDWWDAFRLHEAACLIAGVPVGPNRAPEPEEIPADARPVLKRLISAFYQGQDYLKLPEKIGCHPAKILIGFPRDGTEAMTEFLVSREELHRWIQAMGFKSVYQFLPVEGNTEPVPVGAVSASDDMDGKLAESPPQATTPSPAPVVQAPETKEQRQDRRLKACIDAGLPMNSKAALLRLPDGVGNVADSERVTRQAFSTDVKAALKRRESAKREGSTVHRA